MIVRLGGAVDLMSLTRWHGCNEAYNVIRYCGISSCEGVIEI